MVRTDSLVGQVAIVTGGAQGIGGSCSSLLAEVGAKVLVVDVPSGPLGFGPDTKADEINAAGGEAVGFACDVTQDSDIEAMVAKAVELWGRLDILVNNANGTDPRNQERGITPGGSAVTMHEEAWQYQLSISITAIFRACKRAVPAMEMSGGGGRIVSMASVHGMLAARNSVGYETVKTAIIGMTRQMATDFGPSGITVNAVCPGLIVHPRNGARFDENPKLVSATEAQYPVGRYGVPDDIGHAVRFLWYA
eukprot:COSAG03_NODE_182_length_10965_cov_19.659520_4_plen_251_part_00